jgi:hypothetical protein
MEALALKIAGADLSVSPDTLTVLRIEPVEWRDSSLGCPQGDFNYLSVITPGHLALVRDDNGTMHRVHMTNGRGFVCKKPTTKAKPDTPLPRPNFNQRQLEALSRADLAARLSVPPSDISVVRSRAVDWPDAALRCVADDSATTSNPSKGFVITLAHRGREYTYHSDTRQVTPCPAIESQ